jgi:hypothetical protein
MDCFRTHVSQAYVNTGLTNVQYIFSLDYPSASGDGKSLIN